MLSSDIYYLKSHETVYVRLLPNIDNHRQPFYVQEQHQHNKIGKTYAYALIDNKYVIFYTGQRVYNFVNKNLVEGINPFDLRLDIALEIKYLKLRTPHVFGNIIMSYTTELKYVHDEKYVVWDGTDQGRLDVERMLRFKKRTMEEIANSKRSINEPSDFFQI